jgi:hypothetical protein
MYWRYCVYTITGTVHRNFGKPAILVRFIWLLLAEAFHKFSTWKLYIIILSLLVMLHFTIFNWIFICVISVILLFFSSFLGGRGFCHDDVSLPSLFFCQAGRQLCQVQRLWACLLQVGIQSSFFIVISMKFLHSPVSSFEDPHLFQCRSGSSKLALLRRLIQI